MVLETIFSYFRGTKRPLAESDLPVDAEHVQGGSKRFRNAESYPQSADRIYTTSPLRPSSSRLPAAPPAPSNAPPPSRSESAPIQHSKSLSSLDINKRITIAPPTLAPSNFKFTYTASQTLPSSPAGASATAPRPERKLKRNPNGPISYNGQWKSSKKLNRHASPAFQVPARKPRAEAKDTYEVPADSKRRKVSEAGPSKQADPIPVPAAPASSSTPAAAASTTTAPRTSSSISPPKPSTLSIPSPSRLRPPAKPTTPSRPSPLRQTWSNQPTQTATLMAELITKTQLPKKNSDVSNPYQTANPVANAIPPRRATRRTKKPLDRGAIAKAKADAEAEALKGKEKALAEKDKGKVPYVSAQAQIEATLPPGSKRSRPPPNLMQQPASSSSSQTTPKPYIVEEVADDSEDSARSAKRSKPSSSDIFAKAKSPTGVIPEPTIVDLDEVESSSNDKGTGKQQTADSALAGASVPAPATPSSPFGANPMTRQPTMKSVPKEPSKLRNSFLPETAAPSPPSSSGTVSPPPTFTIVPPPTEFAAPAAAADAPFSSLSPLPPPQPASNVTTEFKAPAFKATPPTSSSFTFKPTIPAPSSSPGNVPRDAHDIKDGSDRIDLDEEEVKQRVRAMDAGSLPVYDFVFSALPDTNTEREHIRGREDVKVLPAAALPSFAFDGQPEGVKSSGASGGFKFDLPGSSGSGSSSKPLFGAPPSGFGAGKGNAFSTPTATSAPVAPAAPAPAAGGFNWAAAGMKAPETKDKWVCAVCDVRNKQEDRKCVACESDRPGAAPSSSSSSSAPASTSLFGSSKPAPTPAVEAPKPLAPPAVGGFNWAAAGMKAPETQNKWVCAVCDVRNKQEDRKCVACESDKPGAASSASASASSSLFGSSASTPAPTPAPVAGFNWAAAGMKAPDTSNKWTCSLCGLSNEQKATQCETCESERPKAAGVSSSSQPSSLTTPTSKPSFFGSSAPTPALGEAPKPPAVPAVGGFNWAAAGMAKPASDKWTCSLCGLSNEQKASLCETCETPR